MKYHQEKKVRLMTMGTMRWLKCICGKARHHVPCCVRWVHIDNSLVHRCTPYASIQARDSERGKISVRASAQYIGSGCVKLAGVKRLAARVYRVWQKCTARGTFMLYQHRQVASQKVKNILKKSKYKPHTVGLYIKSSGWCDD